MVEQTRRRILDAAATSYRELGSRATSMQEVARRAGVSPATVLNHFPNPEQLGEAVVAHIIEALELPAPTIFDTVEGVAARVALLIRQLYEFYARSEVWIAFFFQERSNLLAVASGEARVMGAIDGLLTAALGAFADDRELRAAVGAAVEPGFRGALLRAGLSEAQAVALATELVTGWLTSHLTDTRQADP